MSSARGLLGFCLLAALFSLSAAARAGDPELRWRTVETPRFRVHYPHGLDEAAQRVANLAETIHQRLAPQLAWEPKEVTHIVLTDDTDSANGSANSQPYNTIRLYISAPDDMSVLGDHDDWLLTLLTHEHVHILHLDNRSGLPELLNGIFGKVYTPNHAQPRWIVEGLAVALESEHTGGGRRRSSMFNMMLRADVLEDNFARLDQISHIPRRWPGGNLWYLYGGYFIGWILDTYGTQTFATVAADYGANIIPWGINRSIKAATGRTYVDLYAGWYQHLRREYSEQAAEVRRRGLREGTRITRRGRSAATPRVLPSCYRAQPQVQAVRDELVYYADDGDKPGGIYRVAVGRGFEQLGEPVLLARSTTPGNISFDEDCAMVFDSVGHSKRHYDYRDIWAQPRGTTSPRGLSKSRQRWTTGMRAHSLDISPDGRRAVYVTSSKGTTSLRMAELSREAARAEGEPKLEAARTVVRSRRYDQVYSPKFSPDGKYVAYGVWERGGYRDLALLEVQTGQIRRLTQDRALDQQPVWAPDGSRLYFVSDRGGIANIYSYELLSGRVKMVTNVVNGAYMPALSHDGATLYYMGYTHQGFDLYGMPLDESRFLEAKSSPKARPDAPPEGRRVRYPVREYRALETLGPRSYQAELGPGSFGQSLRVSASGSDVVGLHGFSTQLVIDAEQGEPSLSMSYAYRGLEPTLNISAYRSAVPRGGFRYGGQDLRVVEHITGVTSGISFQESEVYESHSMSLSYTAAKFAQDLRAEFEADPFGPVNRKPHSGLFSSVRLGFSYSNVSSTANAISSERGFGLSTAIEVAAPELGSESTLATITWRGVGYIPMPTAPHHVLALGLSGGLSDGNYPRRGLFATGGFTDTAPIEAFTSGILQSQFLLRGYEPGIFRGKQFHLGNAEYRFPIWHPEFGLSTLPGFLRGLSGALYADYGGAFNAFSPSEPFDALHLGVGGELWIDLVLGYFVRANLKLGYASGLADSNKIPGGQLYFVAQSPF